MTNSCITTCDEPPKLRRVLVDSQSYCSRSKTLHFLITSAHTRFECMFILILSLQQNANRPTETQRFLIQGLLSESLPL